MPRKPGLHNHISAAAFISVRHLSRNHRAGLRNRHAPAPPDPVRLDRRRGSNNHHQIGPSLAPGLQEQRDIQHRDTFACTPNPRQEGRFLLPNHRMQNALKRPQRCSAPKHGLAQHGPIDRPVVHAPGKRRPDRRVPPVRRPLAADARRHQHRRPEFRLAGTRWRR